MNVSSSLILNSSFEKKQISPNQFQNQQINFQNNNNNQFNNNK